MDTTPPDREFCARGEQLYVEAQLDLACWRRSYPQIEHLKAAVADRELAVDSNSPLGLRVAIAQAARFHHEGVSSSRECVLCLEMTLNILTHIHVKPWNVHAKRALADLRRAAMLFAEGEGPQAFEQALQRAYASPADRGPDSFDYCAELARAAARLRAADPYARRRALGSAMLDHTLASRFLNRQSRWMH